MENMASCKDTHYAGLSDLPQELMDQIFDYIRPSLACPGPVALGSREPSIEMTTAIHVLKTLRWISRDWKAKAEAIFFSQNAFKVHPIWTKRNPTGDKGCPPSMHKYILAHVDSILVEFRPRRLNHEIRIGERVYKDRQGRWQHKLEHVRPYHKFWKTRFDRRRATIFRLTYGEICPAWNPVFENKSPHSPLLAEELDAVGRGLSWFAARAIDKYDMDDDELVYAGLGWFPRCCGCDRLTCCECSSDVCIHGGYRLSEAAPLYSAQAKAITPQIGKRPAAGLSDATTTPLIRVVPLARQMLRDWKGRPGRSIMCPTGSDQRTTSKSRGCAGFLSRYLRKFNPFFPNGRTW